MIFDPYPNLIILNTGIVRIIVPNTAKEIVISFESAADDINRNDISRKAFGEKFLLDNNFAVLGVLPTRRNWYRTSDIHRFIESKKLATLLKRFERIHTYGASMGSYGACAFARVLGACNVVAFQPISTLSTELVPWESRFRFGAKSNDWTGDYKDAAEGLVEIASAWFPHDPNCRDSRHVDRLMLRAGTAGKKIEINGGHGVTRFLQKRGILKEFTLACLRGASHAEVQLIVDSNNLCITNLSGQKNEK